MAKSKKGRAGKAARYKAVANGGPSTTRHLTDAIASYLPPRLAATQKFSMADEARHTSHNLSSPESLGSALRGRPVTFVSAGVVEPLKELDEELIAHNNVANNEIPAPLKVQKESVLLQDAPVDDSPKGKENDENNAFFIDTAGDKSLAQRLKDSNPVIVPTSESRPVSSNGSSSGADHIVFKGRNNRQQQQQQQQQQRHTVVTDTIDIQVQDVEHTMQHISLDSGPEPAPQRVPTPPIPAWHFRDHKDNDRDIVDDYIAHMDSENDDDDDEDEDGAQKSQPGLKVSFGTRDLGGGHGDMVIPEESNSDASSADEEEDENDDDEDAADELMEDGEEELEMPEAAEAAFDAAGASNAMDDETLARMLAKQDELGIDEDELVISTEEMARYHNRFGATSNSRIAEFRDGIRHGTERARKGARHIVPSASAIADVLQNDYDLVMDWDRHNPHNPPRKTKAKRGLPTYDHVDPEMEAQLQAIYSRDRMAKAEKKREREEKRAAGLLGKHGNPEDLRVKYPTGITIDQVKEELRAFLQRDDQVLTFPPMDANARKTIHEICSRLCLKSKSAGAGETRRPTVLRTLRTVPYREAAFEAAFARLGRKYFHRMDVNQPRGGRGGRGGGGGGAGKSNGRGVNTASFTYRDGEVVGGGAPELAANNKGRALMEKMGWSAGMALGADDNQGILQPVATVVKRTKAGLG